MEWDEVGDVGMWGFYPSTESSHPMAGAQHNSGRKNELLNFEQNRYVGYVRGWNPFRLPFGQLFCWALRHPVTGVVPIATVRSDASALLCLFKVLGNVFGGTVDAIAHSAHAPFVREIPHRH